ncbi:uncharacterized protein Z518_01633 [Rhinocladiella mackenziei CBS 650.93]|uniref:Uncharacterized protein n=1 Tax=Rhinocladiella mackenziei CBS 650.93 TaxID=1442369 RepID=A0A0D2JM83_9EURO|nr:uncharacterized protein Z518_01633 [Rhinocladiella mackenziei CBS 650.93]KIX10550.1 hypothetical protein Z518_01633 [Rhinocladiella mackenziei CBS 650.93]
MKAVCDHSCFRSFFALGPGLFAAGVASHVLYFIHGERDKEAAHIVQCFAHGFLVLWLAEMVLFWCSSLEAGLVALVGLFCFLAGLGGSIGLYRVLFHRTRRIPGPFGHALTKWTATSIARKTHQWHIHLGYLHNKYGDFVRTGPREVSINDVRAIEPIYGKSSKCLKGPWYDLGGTGYNLHRTRDPDLHRKQRPLWEKGIHEMSIHIEKIKAKTDDFLQHLSTFSGPFNIADELGVFAFNVMGYVLFSLDFDKDEKLRRRAKQGYDTLLRSQSALGVYGQVPWLYSVNDGYPSLGLIPANDNFTRFGNDMVEERRKINPKDPDLFSFLLPTETDPDSAQFPLQWEARLAMVSGSGNVSTALTSSLFYLAHHPDVQVELQNELDPLFGSNTFNPRTAYPILDSVLYESIRLQPLVPSGGERVTPREGIIVGDEFIPGDVVLRVPSFVIFRDPRYFERPKEWIPSRWTSENHLVKSKGAFIPFSTGG